MTLPTTLPEDEVLRCAECGQAIRVVSLAVGFGHVVNPTFRSHYARPARSGHEDTRTGGRALTLHGRIGASVSGRAGARRSLRADEVSVHPARTPIPSERPTP